jgi:hypothetical protein
MNTADIKMCIENENLSIVRDSAEEQLDALIANQIKGRCFTCGNKNCSCVNVSDTFYCADYKREE